MIGEPEKRFLNLQGFHAVTLVVDKLAPAWADWYLVL